MQTEQALQLRTVGQRTPLTHLDEINAVLARIGSRLWPSSFPDIDPQMRELLTRKSLQDEEIDRLKAHCLLSRALLVEIIRAAGRERPALGPRRESAAHAELQ